LKRVANGEFQLRRINEGLENNFLLPHLRRFFSLKKKKKKKGWLKRANYDVRTTQNATGGGEVETRECGETISANMRTENGFSQEKLPFFFSHAKRRRLKNTS